jgi:hypothetical protein
MFFVFVPQLLSKLCAHYLHFGALNRMKWAVAFLTQSITGGGVATIQMAGTGCELWSFDVFWGAGERIEDRGLGERIEHSGVRERAARGGSAWLE